MELQNYIMDKILWLYKKITSIQYPINPTSFISLYSNCKIMTYQKLAKFSNCTIQDIIIANGSTTGCTHYDILNDRYLIMINASKKKQCYR